MPGNKESKKLKLLLNSEKYKKFLVSRRSEEARALIEFILKTLSSFEPNWGQGLRSAELFNYFIDSGIKCNSTTFYKILDDMVENGFIMREKKAAWSGKGKPPTYYRFEYDPWMFLSHAALLEATRRLLKDYETYKKQYHAALELLRRQGYQEPEDAIIEELQTKKQNFDPEEAYFDDLYEFEKKREEMRIKEAELREEGLLNSPPHPKKKKD